MVLVPKKLMALAQELIAKNVRYEDSGAAGPALSTAELNTLTDLGVLVLYGDTMRYKDGAVLLIGNGGMGKSTIASSLSTLWPEECAQLTRDSPMLYAPRASDFPYAFAEEAYNGNRPFLTAFVHPDKFRAYPVKHLIYLKSGKEIHYNSSLEEALQFPSLHGDFRNATNMSVKVAHALRNLIPYTIEKPEGYGGNHRKFEPRFDQTKLTTAARDEFLQLTYAVKDLLDKGKTSQIPHRTTF
jgi:hypothetical protein